MNDDEKAIYEMILRDLFAACALAGLNANLNASIHDTENRERRARIAYGYADAMMRERTKRTNGTT